MTTLQQVELGVLGPLQVRQYGLPVAIPGAKPRAILTMLGLHGGSVVSADTLVELLWGDDPPRTAAKALPTHISSLRRALGDGFVLTEGTGWTLSTIEIDATRYKAAARLGRDAMITGAASQAVARFDEALNLWRGIPELPDGRRGESEKTRWIEGHAALVEDRADALLATGRAAEIVGELEGAIADAPLRERRWGHLMLALYRAGRQGEALGAYQRARSLLADELGVDPGPDLRRLETAIVGQDVSLELPVSHQLSAVTRAVTFLLTDIEGSTAAWEKDADAMAAALARHDEIVEQVVTFRAGRLIKTRGEGDATFSVFDRPSGGAGPARELQEAIRNEPWAPAEPMRIRVALHTGEVEFRDGDYFGRAVNRAARLRSVAAGGQILCSGATAELVIDSLSDDVVLADLGMRQLKNLARPEHVFELRLETVDDSHAPTVDAPMERPDLPAVLAGPGPFVGRGRELEQLLTAWQTTLTAGTRAVLIAGEPGVGKTRLAGEWSRHAYEQGAVVLYGRCDEDLGAPYQPFAEALRSLVPCLGTNRLRGLRGVEALLPLAPGLTDVLPDLAAPPRADADTERYALFDAVVALLGVASTTTPVVLVLDDLHWAAKPTLLLLRHLLRFGEQARLQIVGTYRSTDLDRSHPLAAMLADLHRDGSADRLSLSGLDEDDVTTYVAEAGYDDEELARALASVTGGNPFFLIEALRHVDESGGRWDPSTLPQGVREAVSRRLSRLPAETNKALAAAAVVGSRFAVDLVERVVNDDLVDAFDEACKAGIVIEEPGGRYRFNHAIVRQSLLAELPSVRRMRLHQRIAATLENEPGADDELLAELAYHYFECAWAGNAAKAVDYCRRAADQAMARLAYEGAADLYDKALHALEELDDELPDRGDQLAELLIARCEALLAAGDVVSARDAVSQLQEAAADSARLVAWGICFDGQLSMLTDPDHLDEIESALGAAAEKLAELEDAAGEAKAHTVRAGCLARLGRIGDAETALDEALTAARRAREHRRVNNVLANAPLAALWGPNPVPRAGGRCLDVVRLLRITTGSPVVEATSTRCQGVLDAFRGRAAAGRQLIDSARRSLTELGMRHALLEVDQFAGIVELVADDPASAEPLLRKAYNGFRRMGLDVDTAETAALLARVCLALDRDAEADELCTESEHLAGHALKASIAWRTVRAQLLARSRAYNEARRVAEEAVSVAERTDALVDHGDACLTLATVLDAAGDTAGARAAAERAVGLYELKGAAALAEKARRVLGKRAAPTVSTPPEAPIVEPENACARAVRRADAAFLREAWDEVDKMYAPGAVVESRRKIVGFTRDDLSPGDWTGDMRRLRGTLARHRMLFIAVRGERLALTRLELKTADVSPGAPSEEILQLFGLDDEGRIALLLFFDIDDMDAAVAEMDTAHARLEMQRPHTPLENAASRADDLFNALFAERRWDDYGALLADDLHVEDRRHGLRREGNDRATELAELRAIADVGVATMTSDVLATRGERLVLVRTLYAGRDKRPDAFHTEVLRIAEIDADGRIAAYIAFDLDDPDAALDELDVRYLAGEAAHYSDTWSIIMAAYAGFNRREVPATTQDWLNVDHRHAAAMAPGDGVAYFHASWELAADLNVYIEAVHRLSGLGAVFTHGGKGTSKDGFDAEWRTVDIMTVEGDMINRVELFDEADIDAALARFDELSRPAQQLNNAANQVLVRYLSHFPTRDWDAMAQSLADDFTADDRRHVVNGGVRHGRDSEIANVKATAEIGCTEITSTPVAIRGRTLVLSSHSFTAPDWPEQDIEIIDVVEIDANNQIVAAIAFDPDDIDAAFEELDSRYLAGEAAPYAPGWQYVVNALGELNGHEKGPTLEGLAITDHRRIPFAPGDYGRAIEDLWTLVPDARYRATGVHALDAHGTVISLVIEGTDTAGNELQWARVFSWIFEAARVDAYEEDALDAALARFEELHPQTTQLENAASQVHERFWRDFAARDWAAMAQMLADDYCGDDRRRVVNAGVRNGREAMIANLHAIADLGAGVEVVTTDTIATRGEHLALIREPWSGSDRAAFQDQLLEVLEIDADRRITAAVSFDLEDIDAAFAELDARYLAGEAAAHAHTWSVITAGHAALNRRELPPVAEEGVSIDHRRGAAFGPGEVIPYLRAEIDLDQDIRTRVEVVHRLSDLGAVCTHVGHGTSGDGFDAEWRGVDLLMVDGDLVNHLEIFDEADLDAALARFDALTRPAQRLENAASRMYDRFNAHLMARNWDAMAEAMADDVCNDDRRRVISSGLQRGRDAQIANLRAVVDVGAKNYESIVIATRGDRLALTRSRVSGGGHRAEAFALEMLAVIEIDAEDRISAGITFDLDDLDAAFAELDARYVAGEAAAHADTWSVVAEAHAALNRRELPPTTPDWVNIDHRQGTSFGTGDLFAYIRTAWDLMPVIMGCIEAVHRLTDLGAVVTYAIHGTSQEGFDAEWRQINFLTVGGDLINRIELFDESDLDAALEKFDELHPPPSRLENAATQVYQRAQACLMARDWEALTEILTGDYYLDDRQSVVNVGLRQGRDVAVAEMRASADLGLEFITSEIISTRGERLFLGRIRWSGREEGLEAFHTAVLAVGEINPEEQMVAQVLFDVDDFGAAFEELDARYLAGEAAAHADTWSVITQGYVAANRNELPATTPDLVNIDHRQLAMIETGELIAYLGATFDDLTDISTYIESVHRLTDLGAVVTHVGTGASREGFAAEWRIVNLATVERDLMNRAEIFDETDLDAALARFDELSRPRLENAASQLFERVLTHFAARDWDAMAEDLAAEYSQDDRRRVVNAGIRRGRDAEIESFRSAADLGITHFKPAVVATRGQCVSLTYARSWARDQGPEAFIAENLFVVEVDADNRGVAAVVFDPDDIEAAFAELDARYAAGEAAAHSHTWSVITRAHAAFNRRELPVKPPEFLDHRPLVTIEAGDPTGNIREMWDFTPDLKLYIEAVHRLTDLGAVITQTSRGTSQAGFGAEWRVVELLTIDGELIKRGELFEEADLDAALARFDELSRPTPRLENAASQVYERLWARFRAREWDALAELIADDIANQDRRRVVNAGIEQGRDVLVANMRTLADIGATVSSDVIATRGQRLILTRVRSSNSDLRRGEFESEMLVIVEIDSDGRIAAGVQFDLDDIDTAVEQLDARYLAGEAAAHADTWSIVVEAYAALNRRELPPTTPDWVNVDHRQGTTFEPGGFFAFVRAAWDVAPSLRRSVAAVHRLSNLGVVFTHTAHGTSPEGFEAEWRSLALVTVDGDLIDGFELFDEADIDAALARFDELSRPRLENQASQVNERFFAYFVARDWDALAETVAEDISNDDRRPIVGSGLRHGRDAEIVDARAIAGLGTTHVASTVIATRGERLILTRTRFSGPETFPNEVLGVVEINADNQIAAVVVFGLDDIDDAFEELDARYAAGEAADYAPTWRVIAGAYTTLNRREIPATTPDWVNIDHRQMAMADSADLTTFLCATWDLMPSASVHIVAVHRISNLGAVVTQASHGTSQEGFDAEWQEITITMVTGGLVSRCELFDESDLDAALARFDELNRPAPQLENAATRNWARLADAFNRRDPDGYLALTTADGRFEDRRKGLGGSFGGPERRKAALVAFEAAPEGWQMEVENVALRGSRLGLTRVALRDTTDAEQPITNDLLLVMESHGELIHDTVSFDADDLEAALDELDTRYVAGEAATHAHTWSLVVRIYADFNRRELPSTTGDCESIDHRRGTAFAPGDMIPYLSATWEVAPDVKIFIEAVHRLSDRGAVVTHRAHGASQEGFAAEWREITILAFDGALMSRAEIFDEADLDAALARFDELTSPAGRLENRATQVDERFRTSFAARDWHAMAKTMAEDISTDDRRRVVGAGLRPGRAANMADMQAVAEVGTEVIDSSVIATRGARLALGRSCFTVRDRTAEEFRVEMLRILEVTTDNQMRACVMFDLDDIDAAFDELDSRYLAGEAAAHAHTWSVITNANAAFNRHEMPQTTPDWTNIDHRRVTAFAAGDQKAYIRATWDVAPDVRNRFVVVHRLNDHGAVVTQVAQATSHEGFDAEWQEIVMVAVDGDLLNRCEIFDEVDLDAALARFDELNRSAR